MKPASSAHSYSSMRRLFALIGAPAVWVVQVTLSEALASHACYPGTAPLGAPLWPWLEPALIAINLICFALGGHALCSARLINREAPEGQAQERQRFMNRIMMLSSGIFFIAILFTICAVLILSPCHRWT